MKDYYQILGVNNKATDTEIKKAYRKLSMKFHPDKNPGDPYFEHMFKAINEAYENLSDVSKRSSYDRSFNTSSNRGYKSYSENAPPKKSPEIISLEISEASVSAGGSITVSFQVKNATSVTLNNKFKTPKLQSSIIIKIPATWKENYFQVTLQAYNDELSAQSSIKVPITIQENNEKATVEKIEKQTNEKTQPASNPSEETISRPPRKPAFSSWILLLVLLIIGGISYLWVDNTLLLDTMSSKPQSDVNSKLPIQIPQNSETNLGRKLFTHDLNYIGISYEITQNYLSKQEDELTPVSLRLNEYDEQLWGFMNSKGEWVIPRNYDEVKHFRNGYAGVKYLGKWGFIDKLNKFVIPPVYDNVEVFNEGKAGVWKDGKLGFINSNNQIVVPFNFLVGHYGMGDIDAFFSEGRAAVGDETGYGLIDENGNKISEFKYDRLDYFENDSSYADWRHEIDHEVFMYTGYINRNGLVHQISDPFKASFDLSSGFEYYESDDQSMQLKYTSSSEEIVNQIKQNMILLEGGTFRRGCNSSYRAETLACESNENPVINVALSPFSISKFEVTQLQWEVIMGNNPSSFSNCPRCPVENVSYNEVQLFIEKLNQFKNGTFRLPTEAEWEYAAKETIGDYGTKIFSGCSDLEYHGWYIKNSFNRPHPVGTRIPNNLGLYDMSGNVWEWCNDWYGERYYDTQDTINPQGPRTGTQRVFRGGSFNSTAKNCRVSNRGSYLPTRKNTNIGFRLVMEREAGN